MKTFAVKDLLLVAAVIIIVLLIFFGGCQRKRAVKLAEENTEVKTENLFYKQDNRDIRVSLAVNENQRELVEKENVELIKERDKLKNDKHLLQQHLSNIIDLVNSIPADSNYAFLNTVAYPFEGDQIFPFNELQIKGFHRSYLENIDLNRLSGISTAELANCELRLTNTLTLKESFKNSLVLAENQIQNDSIIIQNLEDHSALVSKEVKKQDRRKRFWRTISLTETVVIVILSIL